MEAMQTNKNNINDIVDIVYLTPENAKFTISENNFLQLNANVEYPETLQDSAKKESEDNKENENQADKIEEFFFERIFLHRAFPFDNPYKYISVVGNFPKREEDKKEDEEKKDSSSTPPNEEGNENKNSNSTEENKGDSPAQPRENTTSLGDLKEIGIISDIAIFDDIQQQYIINELDRKYFVPVIDFIYSMKDKFGFSYWEVKTNVGKIKFTVNDAYRNILKVTDDRIMINDVNGNRYEIKSLENFDQSSYRKIEIYL
ncbi:MAG: DUF1854 domain-containing protein [Oscillospiraceae bacterium]|nr:DUF1854 domain-containing protein [Oscillospiraceae bacterium]